MGEEKKKVLGYHVFRDIMRSSLPFRLGVYFGMLNFILRLPSLLEKADGKIDCIYNDHHCDKRKNQWHPVSAAANA